MSEMLTQTNTLQRNQQKGGCVSQTNNFVSPSQIYNLLFEYHKSKKKQVKESEFIICWLYNL